MYKKIIIAVVLCIGSWMASAQSSKDYEPNLPDYSGSSSAVDPVATSTPTPPPPIPVDGGAGFLLAAGVGYGIRQFRKRKQSL